MSGSVSDIDLLINPKMGGMANLETVDLPTISFDDMGSSAPAGPQLVPSLESTGPIQMNGMDNLNAEPYAPAPKQIRHMSDEALMKEKYEILRKFERLSKMGVPMRKRFTMDSPLDEMKMELEFIKREKNMDATIKQFSEWFVTGMSGLEYGSKHVSLLKAFGLQLDGLSEAAQMNVVDLEDDFEELYDMYGENMKMHPLVKIPMRVCMMVYMVHLTNQMTRKAPIPNIDEIMRQNPDIARSLAAAAMQNQSAQSRTTANVPPPPQAQNPLAGLMSFMQSGMPPGPPPSAVPRAPAADKQVKIGGRAKVVSASPPPAPAPAPAPVQEVRGPSVNIEDLLKNIKETVVVPSGNGPPPAVPASALRSSGSKKNAGSTGKNSVVIKL
jgi:hypothetical protein